MSNTREITRSKANDMNLSLSAKNFPLGHASSKVLEGSLLASFLDNELKSIGSDCVEGAPWCITHHRHETKGCKWFQMVQRIRSKCNCRGTNSWKYRWHNSRVWQISDHDDVAEIKWKEKMNGPTLEGQWWKEDTPTWHKTSSVMFKSELLTQLIEFPNCPPPFLAGTPIIFYH